MRTLEQIDREIMVLEKELDDCKGTPTEVYTRIVGYYRAVDNWNRGKKEEYYQRSTYNFDESMVEEKSILGIYENKEEKSAKKTLKTIKSGEVASYKLFTSQYCRNCPPVKNYVTGLDIAGEEIDVSTDLGISASKDYEIMSTPTVILLNKNNTILKRVHAVSELKEIFSDQKELVTSK